MSSSVPDFSIEARKALQEAAEILRFETISDGERLRAQGIASLGVGYAILAVDQHLSRLEPPLNVFGDQ